MAITYIKKASKTAETGSDETARTVSEMLTSLEHGAEDAVRDYCRKFDQWEGEIVVARELIEQATKSLPESVKDDIRFAHAMTGDVRLEKYFPEQKFELRGEIDHL